jgi:hypothetical protein
MARTSFLTIAAALLLVSRLGQPGELRVSGEEAADVAQNWVALITEKTGSWAGVTDAQVVEVQELSSAGRTVGFFCRVEPRGWIVVPFDHALAPVKAYSTLEDLDPAEDYGIAQLIKDDLGGALESMFRAEAAGATAVVQSGSALAVGKHRALWDQLSRNPAAFSAALRSGMLTVNYQSGSLLLSSAWHQGDPYYRQTPAGDTCSHTKVGCVATAAAIIMQYWRWPPAGNDDEAYLDPYDWPNMPDRFASWRSYTQAEYDAVAELCHEIGNAVDMDYGCGESSADTSDMEDVYPDNFFFHADKIDRDDYEDYEWYSKIKESLNENMPIQYRVNQHSMVVDGWSEIGSTRKYHVNYGWANSKTAWYDLDKLHYPAGGSLDDEFMIREIYPVSKIAGGGCAISGTFNLDQTWTFRYFHKDTCGGPATFVAGQFLQFLPGARLASTTGTIRIDSTDAQRTTLFTHGDMTKGIRMYDGSIIVSQNGSLNFYPIGAPRYVVATAISSGHVSLSWEDGYGFEAGFEVERAEKDQSGSWAWTHVASESSTNNAYIDLTSETSTAYLYRVRATGFGGASIYSNEASVTTSSQ